MAKPSSSFRIAAVQAAPAFLDREATIEKACELIAEAGRNDAELVVFTESFVPAYPDWVWAVPPGEEGMLNELYAELLANSVEVPGGELIAGPLHEQEGILYAEVDPAQMRGPRWMLDVAGHYARPDVFELVVHTEARPMIVTRERGAAKADGARGSEKLTRAI